MPVVNPPPGKTLCDFCGDEHAVWFFPAGTFVIDDKHGSLGAWAACTACHALIQADEREKLSEAAVRRLELKNGRLPRDMRREVVRKVTAMHAKFWAARLGAPYPIGTPFDGETQRSTP